MIAEAHNNIADYKNYILNLAKNNKNVVFFNSSEEHGALVMGTMFRYATQEVNIYCGSLSGHISSKPEYTSGLKCFLQNGGKLRILMQGDKYKQDSPPELFKILKFYSILKPDNIEIKVHPYKVTQNSGNHEVHFMVADKKMYRVEDNIDSFTAACNFNDPEKASQFDVVFNQIFNDKILSKPISL